MIPEANITSWKVSVNWAGMGGWGGSEPLIGEFSGQSPLRKFLGSKKNLDRFKIGAEIITVQVYKHIKN